MNFLSILLSLLPAILTIISFAFTTLTTVSQDWAHQHHYNTTSQGEWLPTSIIYTTYRAPFYACTPTAYLNGVQQGPEFLTNLEGSVSSALAIAAEPGFHVENGCQRFKPYGLGKTSCETPAAPNGTGADGNARQGDDRMCQQVHMAGSLSIAASVFSGLALLTTLTFGVVSVVSSTTSSAKLGLGVSSALFLLLSAALLFIGQFYGVLGLVQSQIPNGSFSSNPVTGTNDGPWTQGKASVIYASTGWFAALCAVAILLSKGVVEGAQAKVAGNVGAGNTVGEPGLWSGTKREKDV